VRRFALPRILDRVADRAIMIGASFLLVLGLAALTAISAMIPPGQAYWHILLGGWLLLGVAYSMSVTPGGRLLRRSASSEDRPALFAAQFALSHVCWLIAYPLVGQLGARVSMTAAFGGMARWRRLVRSRRCCCGRRTTRTRCRTVTMIFRPIIPISVTLTPTAMPSTPS
jgi:MFS family permease